MGNMVNTRGDHTVAPMITYNGESTRQGSVPFARGGDTLVAAVLYSQPILRCGVVWVNITSARNPARAPGRMTLMTGRQPRCTSRLAAATASQLLQHSSCKRRPASPLPPPPPSCLRRFAALLHSVRRPQDLHITLSTVQWKEGLSLNIGYSRAATYAFFTNLARWKFAYENCLVEISRDSREKIV